jgi:hypothetical protein
LLRNLSWNDLWVAYFQNYEEMSIFSHNSHLEWRVGLSDIIVKGTLPARFGLIWFSSFRGKDLIKITLKSFAQKFELKWSLGGPLSKLCVTPPFSINFRCQIENQVNMPNLHNRFINWLKEKFHRKTRIIC